MLMYGAGADSDTQGLLIVQDALNNSVHLDYSATISAFSECGILIISFWL